MQLAPRIAPARQGDGSGYRRGAEGADPERSADAAGLSQRTIKTDRRLTRDSSYVAEFVNTPIKLEDVAVELSDEEAAMLDALRLPVHGADHGAALHPFHMVFLGAAESGAPAIGDRKPSSDG
jgi:hypothetical protein